MLLLTVTNSHVTGIFCHVFWVGSQKCDSWVQWKVRVSFCQIFPHSPPEGLPHWLFPPPVYQHAFPTTVCPGKCILKLVSFCQSDRRAVVAECSFNLHFSLPMSEIEHLFTSLKTGFYHFLCLLLFLIGFVVIFCLSKKIGVSCTLGILFLFSMIHVVNFLFINFHKYFLMAFLPCLMFLFFIKLNLFIFYNIWIFYSQIDILFLHSD